MGNFSCCKTYFLLKNLQCHDNVTRELRKIYVLKAMQDLILSLDKYGPYLTKYRHRFCSQNSVETWRRFYKFCDHILKKGGFPYDVIKGKNSFDIYVKGICLVTLILSLSKSNQKWKIYGEKRVENDNVWKMLGSPPFKSGLSQD